LGDVLDPALTGAREAGNHQVDALLGALGRVAHAGLLEGGRVLGRELGAGRAVPALAAAAVVSARSTGVPALTGVSPRSARPRAPGAEVASHPAPTGGSAGSGVSAIAGAATQTDHGHHQDEKPS